MPERFHVFISHSYADREYVEPLREELQALDMRCYVDWLDDAELDRDKVDRKTADILRGRLSQVQCLIYILSPHSAASRWMPWELGFFDGKVGRVGIWPTPDLDCSGFSEREYLGLYPLLSSKKSLVDFLNEAAGENAAFLATPRAIEAGLLTLGELGYLAKHDPAQAWREWNTYWAGVWTQWMKKPWG